MFTVDARGAEDAWWETGLMLEIAEEHDEHTTGGAVDIRNCFDQLIRTLIYAQAKAAGMPQGVLSAYVTFQEKLTTRNSLAGGLGKAYTKPCGIPQGCPLSMMFVALDMRPWTQMVKDMGGHPRILADDMFLKTQGEDHVNHFV